MKEETRRDENKFALRVQYKTSSQRSDVVVSHASRSEANTRMPKKSGKDETKTKARPTTKTMTMTMTMT